jgi:hypothetical protein
MRLTDSHPRKDCRYINISSRIRKYLIMSKVLFGDSPAQRICK